MTGFDIEGFNKLPNNTKKQPIDVDSKKQILLMCKNTCVLNITTGTVLNENLLPGCIKRGTLDYSGWMKTRYSAGSNVSARRLMLRAFGSDNHNTSLEITRALSLSDCYWIKQETESVTFESVTPYLNKEWNGSGIFTGGSISTLFVNGAADKRWLDSSELLKVSSFKEIDAYDLCKAIGLEQYSANATISDSGIVLRNFTSTEVFFESMEQSGFVSELVDPLDAAIRGFKEQMIGLIVVDQLVEHDDRHFGNYGFLRDANTGAYLSMAPYFDFDWLWSDNVYVIPEIAFELYAEYMATLCDKAKKVSGDFKYGATIIKRANELLERINAYKSKDSQAWKDQK